MSVKYTYSIQNEFPNQEVSIPSLREEIEALGGTATLEYINVDYSKDECDIWIDRVLSGPENNALDGAVAAHQGARREVLILHTQHKLIDSTVNITQTTTWQELGGVAAEPTLWVPESRLDNLFVRIMGAVRTQGTEVQIVVAEDLGGDGSDIQTIVSPPFDVPNTGNTWRFGEFDTNVPVRAGKNIYYLAGRIRGSTSASIRWAAAYVYEKRFYR